MSQMTFSDYPYYPNGKRGRPTKGIEKMLRMYLLQISISSAMIFFFPSLIGSLFLLAIKNQPPVLFIFYHS